MRLNKFSNRLVNPWFRNRNILKNHYKVNRAKWQIKVEPARKSTEDTSQEKVNQTRQWMMIFFVRKEIRKNWKRFRFNQTRTRKTILSSRTTNRTRLSPFSYVHNLPTKTKRKSNAANQKTSQLKILDKSCLTKDYFLPGLSNKRNFS